MVFCVLDYSFFSGVSGNYLIIKRKKALPVTPAMLKTRKQFLFRAKR